MNINDIVAIIQHYEQASCSKTIHPNDQMNNAHYFTVGRSGLDCVLHGLSVTYRMKVERVLDLPCGHGRVARHLKAAFPEAEMFYCDLDHEGVEFCAETFEGEGIKSETDLLKVGLPNQLDVIWVGSLFTHLDSERTSSWLRYLASHLRENGILVATFHGYFVRERIRAHGLVPAGSPDLAKIMSEFEEQGFGYAQYTTLDMGDYGLSLSTPSAILEIANEIAGVRVASYTERGWANNHDVLVLNKNERLTPFEADLR